MKARMITDTWDSTIIEQLGYADDYYEDGVECDCGNPITLGSEVEILELEDGNKIIFCSEYCALTYVEDEHIQLC